MTTWICLRCRHLHQPVDALFPTCDAFPDGLPWIMQSGNDDHKEPLEGDHGIRFEPRDEDTE